MRLGPLIRHARGSDARCRGLCGRARSRAPTEHRSNSFPLLRRWSGFRSNRGASSSRATFDLAGFPRRRGASPPPLWGRDRVGGRADRNPGRFTERCSHFLQRPREKAPIASAWRDPPPRPAPTRGAGEKPASGDNARRGRQSHFVFSPSMAMSGSRTLFLGLRASARPASAEARS
jgi:hypothetical protein